MEPQGNRHPRAMSDHDSDSSGGDEGEGGDGVILTNEIATVDDCKSALVDVFSSLDWSKNEKQGHLLQGCLDFMHKLKDDAKMFSFCMQRDAEDLDYEYIDNAGVRLCALKHRCSVDDNSDRATLRGFGYNFVNGKFGEKNKDDAAQGGAKKKKRARSGAGAE